MLKNQLALTEGVRANQRAITEGFNQFERLADLTELSDDPWDREWVPELRPPDYEDIEEKLEYYSIQKETLMEKILLF